MGQVVDIDTRSKLLLKGISNHFINAELPKADATPTTFTKLTVVVSTLYPLLVLLTYKLSINIGNPFCID